jgi:predicted amidophosphoribosyltransferase
VLDRLLGILAPPRCAGCDALLAREAVFCAACLSTIEPPPRLPPHVTASFAYGGAIADAIRSCKFRGRVDRLRLLARLVIVRLPSVDIDVVAPVPLHPARLRERGFDQAAILASAVARALDKPCAMELLSRVVDTPHLANLDAHARADAIGDAFVARPFTGRVLLVDDVHTTGATLAAAACALAGPSFAHVLAATPRE